MPQTKPLLSVDFKYKGSSAGLEKLDQAVRRIPDRTRQATLKWLNVATQEVAKELRSRLAFKGDKAPVGRLKVQSGQLRQSIRTKVDQRKLEGEVGTNVLHAKIHEFGGVITPKKAKFLVIPIEGALGKKARNLGSPRDYPDLVFIGRSAGIVSDGKYEPVFALAKEVKIPKREPFKKAREAKERQVVRDYDRLVKRELTKDF